MIVQNRFWLFIILAVVLFGSFFAYERYMAPPKIVPFSTQFNAYKSWPIIYRYSANDAMDITTSKSAVFSGAEDESGGSGTMVLFYSPNPVSPDVFDFDLNWLEIYTGKEYLASVDIDFSQYSYLRENDYGNRIEVTFEKNGAALIHVASETLVVRNLQGEITRDRKRTLVTLICGAEVKKVITPLKTLYNENYGIELAEKYVSQYRGGFVPEDSCEGISRS